VVTSSFGEDETQQSRGTLTLGYATSESENETWEMVQWVKCVVLFGESGTNVPAMWECPLVSEIGVGVFKLPKGAT
jgi:hypothetical protein